MDRIAAALSPQHAKATGGFILAIGILAAWVVMRLVQFAG
jgi:hypothetical protein